MMSKTYKRVFCYITNTKEPKGHCEAMKYRNENGIAVAKRNFKRELGAKR